MSKTGYVVCALDPDYLPVQIAVDSHELAEELAELMRTRGFSEIRIAEPDPDAQTDA